MSTLDRVPLNSTVRIAAVGGAPALAQRLYEFGFLEGENVRVTAVAPFGDPIEVEVLCSRVSLRRAEAAHVHVHTT